MDLQLPDKVKFYEHLNVIINSKRQDNSAFLSEEKYKEILEKVKLGKRPGMKKEDYRRLARYAVVTVEGVEHLIAPLSDGAARMRFFIKNEDLYDALVEVHRETGHGGRNKMVPALAAKYVNVSQETVALFLKLCGVCLTKYQAKKRGVTVRPLVFSQLNDRVQIDLIDFQSRPDGDFKFILNYQDHVTKFVVLRPLKQKTAAEVAHHVLDLFTLLGCPSVLQSDNGREFCNSIINSLRELYPDLKIVHGLPRHSQSQGSVENANKQVQRILETELLERRTTHWVTLLPFVQLKKNTAYHEAIKMSPYEAVFGRPMKTGLGSTLPPTLVPSLGTLRTEEQLVELLESIQVPEPAPPSARPSIPQPAPSTSSASPSTPEPAPSTPDSIPSPADHSAPSSPFGRVAPLAESNRPSTSRAASTPLSSRRAPTVQFSLPAPSPGAYTGRPSPPSFSGSPFRGFLAAEHICETCTLSGAGAACSRCGRLHHAECLQHGLCGVCGRGRLVQERQDTARANIIKQASKMLAASRRSMPPASVGDTVYIPVPDVDRARGNPKNVAGVVVGVTPDGFYRIGNSDGTLNHLLARNMFTVAPLPILDLATVSDVPASLRQLAGQGGPQGTQGFLRCNCTTRCVNNRCNCRRSGIKCNSKCHGSTTCSNK